MCMHKRLKNFLHQELIRNITIPVKPFKNRSTNLSCVPGSRLLKRTQVLSLLAETFDIEKFSVNDILSTQVLQCCMSKY